MQFIHRLGWGGHIQKGGSGRPREGEEIIEDAEAEARSIREEALKTGAVEAAKEVKRMMADAERAAAKIGKSKPSAAMVKQVADEIAKGIVGE